MSETGTIAKFQELDEEIENHFMRIFGSKSFPTNVKFAFLGATKQKELVKIKKIADDYAFLLGEKELLVSFNTDLYDAMDDESLDILIETAIEGISIKIDTGKITINTPPIKTFESIVNKYGISKIGRASQIVDLVDEQKQDDSLVVN
jgi:hypothetical protein